MKMMEVRVLMILKQSNFLIYLVVDVSKLYDEEERDL